MGIIWLCLILPLSPLKRELASAVSIKVLEIQSVRTFGQEGSSPWLALEPHIYSVCGLKKQKEEKSKWGYHRIILKIKKVLFLERGNL